MKFAFYEQHKSVSKFDCRESVLPVMSFLIIIMDWAHAKWQLVRAACGACLDALWFSFKREAS